MKKIYIALVLLMSSIVSNAQTMDKKWNVGFHGGATQYNGDLGNDFYQELDPFYAFGGVSFSRLLGDRFDLNLIITKGEMGFRSDTAKLRSSLTTATFNFRFNILNSKSLIRPYIFI